MDSDRYQVRVTDLHHEQIWLLPQDRRGPCSPPQEVIEETAVLLQLYLNEELELLAASTPSKLEHGALGAPRAFQVLLILAPGWHPEGSCEMRIYEIGILASQQAG